MGNVLEIYTSTISRWQKEQDLVPQQQKFCQQAVQAVRKGDVAALKDLMEVPSSMGGIALQSVVDPHSTSTLLHIAMETPWTEGSKECVRFLVEAGCEMTKMNQSRETPLHMACMTDNLEGLLMALEAGPINLEMKDRWRRTLLLKSIIYNSQRVMKKLLTLGVDLNTQDVFGLSVVHVAVSYGRVDLLRELVSRGAALNLLNERYRTPLSLAISAHNGRMVHELLLLGSSIHNPRFMEPVVLAISELIRRSENGRVCEQSEEVLHLMLAAHGLPIESDEPDVFQRVLYAANIEWFLPLLHKLHICSGQPYDDLQSRATMPQQTSRNTSTLRSPVSLCDLARRTGRLALMSSGWNVVWAVERLPLCIPPAVKGLLLLTDCDHKQFPVVCKSL